MTSKLTTFLRENPLVLPLYLPTIFFSTSAAMLIPVLPIFADSFDVTYDVIGIVLAGESIGTLLGDVPAGMLLRRFSQKSVMLIGLAVTALSVMALAFVGSIWLVFVLQIFSGVGIALYNISRHAYLTNNSNVTNRGRAISIFAGMFRIGNFLGPGLGGSIGENISLVAPFIVYGAGCTAAFLSVLIFLKNPKVEIVSTETHHNVLKTIRENYKVLFSAGAGQLFGQMIRAGRKVLIPLFAADVIGLDLEQTGIIISVAAFVDMCMFIIAGYVMDRFGRLYAIVPCFGIQGLAMLLIPFTTSFESLLVVMVMMGLANGLGSGTMMTVGADLAPPDQRGEFLGVWRLIGDSGFMGAPLIVGVVAQVVALPMAAVAMAFAGFTAAGIFAFRVPETLENRRVKPREV